MTSDSTLSEPLHQQPLSPEPIREHLAAQQQQRHQRFLLGEAARTLIRERSDEVDKVLTAIWDQIGPTGAKEALIAVGGYGRQELHPFSDIDLLILTDGNSENQPSISAFITLLWDLGLQIGHSVRSIDECIEESRNDVTVATNLLEARLLSGSHTQFEQFQQQIGDDAIWPSGPFFIAKRNEQQARLQKYNETAYNLEPNIKEGPGGLRDIQNILWVTRRHFGSSNPQELVEHQFLTKAECTDLEAGQERLWEIRFALHLIAGRPEERLLFEHQPELAQHFGHLDNDKNRGVESFMHSYFRIIRELSRLNEMLLQLFEEQLLIPPESRETHPIDKHFGISNGYLTLLNPDSMKQDPSLTLTLFLVLRQHPKLKGVTAETLRQLRATRHAIDDSFRHDRNNQHRFLELFYSPTGLTHSLRRMNRYGILGAWMPEFERIIGLMQYDLFHAYTVDEHTLFVIRNLRRFTIPEHREESPLQSELMAQLEHPEQLYLAALFHDIAKGRGGDHSQLGSEVVQTFCTQYQINPETAAEISWLVENHLLMSTFAQRRDIDDPQEIHAFAQLVGTLARLKMLYLLTVADIRATNRTLWNHWKDTLLSRLYQLTSSALERGLQQPEESDDRITENRRTARELLRQDQCTEEEINDLWSHFEEEYFQKQDAREISWHTCSIIRSNQFPLVQLREESHHGGTEILIYSRDRQFLFPILVHTLESLGLEIQAAKINTTLNSYALDIFTVLDQQGKTIRDPEWAQQIQQTLQKEIEQPTLLEQPTLYRQSRHQKHFHDESIIQFCQDARKAQTILEVHATDRPGLLSTICRVLMEHNVRIQGAKIATLGERIEDLFWITHQDNQPLEQIEEQQQIAEDLRLALDPE